MILPTVIDSIENKARLLGRETVRNEWSIAVSDVDNLYKIWSEVGEIPGKFLSVIPDKHFTVAVDANSLNKRKSYKLFVRGTNKHVLGNAKLLEVSIAYDLRDARTRKLAFKGGDVALATGINYNYIVASSGRTLKVKKTVLYVTLNNASDTTIIELHGSIFGSKPIGWVSHDLTRISDKSLLA